MRQETVGVGLLGMIRLHRLAMCVESAPHRA